MIKFKHQQPDKDSSWPRGTFAIVLPSKKNLLSMIAGGVDTIDILLGKALFFPKEQFVKSIGREVATKRLKTFNVKLKDVTIRHNNRVVFEFSVLEDPSVTFGVSYVPESEHTRLEYMYME